MDCRVKPGNDERRKSSSPLQTSEIILAARFAAPEFCAVGAPEKLEGARNAGERQAPHGPVHE
jgi:hypothetical protein